MKKTLLSLALCFLGMGAMAQTLTSPYIGTTPELDGVYYLYNVKAEKWLGAGYGCWAVQFGIDEQGMPVKLVKNSGGNYALQLMGSVTSNDRNVTYTNLYWGWQDGYDSNAEDKCYAPADFGFKYSGSYVCNVTEDRAEGIYLTSVDGVSNGYKININAQGTLPYFTYVENSDVMHLKLADATNGYDVWQFVTYDERNHINASVYHGAEPVDGGKYYLYNVKTGKWFATSGGRYNTAGSVAETGDEVQLESYNGGFAIKTISVTSKNYETYYGWVAANKVNDYFVDSEAKERFNFEAVGNNRYKIILNYNKDRHLAAADGDHPVTATYEEGADLWLLVTSAEHDFTSKSVEFAAAAEGYATLCLPRQTVIPSGVTAYKASEPDADNYVTLTAIEGNTLPAYEAVLLKGVAGESYTFEADENAAIKNFSDNCFRGNSSAEAVAVPDEYSYILTLGKGKASNEIGFYKYTGSEIGANKAYYPVAAASGTSLARGFAINLGGDETGVSMLNGQSSNGQCFDLQGRRVSKPQHGIYIVNGKTVIIK